MTERNRAHLQTMTAIWGQVPGEAHTLADEGFLSPTANPFAVAFSEDLHLFAGLSRARMTFFELWEEKQFSVVSTKTSETPSSAQTSNSCESPTKGSGRPDGEYNTPLRWGGSRDTSANWQGRTGDVHWSSRARKSSWHIKHTTKAVTIETDPRCKSQSSRNSVSIAAAHLQIVPQRRITSSTHGPEALAKETAVR